MMYSKTAQMAIERFAECEGTTEIDIENVRRQISAVASAKNCKAATVTTSDVLHAINKLGFRSEAAQVFRAVRG